jgi:hypothetical protein
VSEKSITRQQAGRFRRAKNEPSERSSFAGVCSGHKFLASRVEVALGLCELRVQIRNSGSISHRVYMTGNRPNRIPAKAYGGSSH